MANYGPVPRKTDSTENSLVGAKLIFYNGLSIKKQCVRCEEYLKLQQHCLFMYLRVLVEYTVCTQMFGDYCEHMLHCCFIFTPP